MRKIFYVLFTVVLFANGKAFSQSDAMYNSYYINPYLYNPAEAASEYAYAFVNHRTQWTNIEGAPVLTTINFTTLIDESRSAFGFKASSFERGLLKTTDFHLTYAYGVALNKKSHLYFALSGGAISNSLDIENLDTSDPAVANYLSNNLQPSANFGMLLRSASGLNLGVSLPQLFIPKFNSAKSFESTNLSPLDDIIVSAYFRKKVEERMVTKTKRGVRKRVMKEEGNAPLEIYALYRYASVGPGQFEATAKLNLSNNFWLGAGWRQAYGFSGLVGLSIKSFMLSYSYEPGTQIVPSFSSASHEVQLGIRFGDAKKYKSEAPPLRSTLGTQSESHSARFQQADEDPDLAQTNKPEDKRIYYVVIRVFGDFMPADEYKKKLIDQKFNGNIVYNKADKKYYVYVFKTKRSADAHEEARNLKNHTKLKEARVVSIAEK